MTLVKICGITNKRDALGAAGLGADMLGFVFYRVSKRYVDPKLARDINKEMPPSAVKVGVFVDEEKDKVLAIAEDAGLDILQFHGSETAEYCASFSPRFKVMKAFRVKDKMSLTDVNGYNTDYYLFDTYDDRPASAGGAAGKASTPFAAGGTGKVFDWSLLKNLHIFKPFLISGGLNTQNVGQAIKEFTPYGVDVSSSLEISPGKKNMDLVKRFIEEVRRVG